MSFLYPGIGGERIRLLAPASTPIQHTIICWIKPASIPGSGFSTIQTIGTAPTGLLIDTTGKIRIFQAFGGGAGDWNVSAGVSAGSWLAIAMSYDGGSTSNTPILYSRLESDPSLVSRTVTLGTAPIGSFTVIGSGGDYWDAASVNTSYPFDGRIAYTQIFNRILNSTEMNAAVNVPGSVTSGLILDWKQLDDPSSDHTADDSSGNGNDGTVGTSVTLSGDNPTLSAAGFALIDHKSAAYTTADSGATTVAMDTTGAKLLVAEVADLSGATALTDSKSNVWLLVGSTVQPALYYCINPITDAAHTFNIAGLGEFASIGVAAYSYSSTPALDQINHHTTTGPTASVSTNSVTPTTANQLLVAAHWHLGVYSSIDSGFTKLENVDHTGGGTPVGMVLSHLIETSIAAQNPTVTMSASTGFNTSGVIATFKAAPSGGISLGVLRRRR